MMLTVRRFLNNMPLKRRILAIVLCVIFIISAVALVAISVISNSFHRVLYKTSAASLSYTATDISKDLNSIGNISLLMLSDYILQNNLAVIKYSDDATFRRNAYQLLYISVQSYYSQLKQNGVSYVSLYTENYSTHSYDLKAEIPDEIKQKLYDTAVKNLGREVWVTDYCGEYGLFLVRSVRQILNLDLSTMGVIVICVDVDSLVKKSTAYMDMSEDILCLIYDKNNLIYQTGDNKNLDVSMLQKQLSGTGKVAQIGKTPYFYVKGNIFNFDWNYIMLVPYEAIYSSVVFSLQIAVLFIGVSIIITFLLSNKLIYSVTRHFETLIDKMRGFGKGDILPANSYDYSGRKDEIGMLHTQFDNMAEQINNLINVNYVNEILMKDAQLKALQMQINPHFLYNTLESVNWRAKLIGEKNISLMTESLGRLLRITLDEEKNRSFTLGEELDLVKSYMTIQQIRFEDQLICKTKIEESLLDAIIPKLTIQPLLENAIHYGLEQMTDMFEIEIIVKRQADNMLVEVKNNGPAFEDNLMEKLKNKQIITRGLGIGLLNIDQRLKLTFGDEYGIILYNHNEMAVARIVIPYTTV